MMLQQVHVFSTSTTADIKNGIRVWNEWIQRPIPCKLKQPVYLKQPDESCVNSLLLSCSKPFMSKQRSGANGRQLMTVFSCLPALPAASQWFHKASRRWFWFEAWLSRELMTWERRFAASPHLCCEPLGCSKVAVQAYAVNPEQTPHGAPSLSLESRSGDCFQMSQAPYVRSSGSSADCLPRLGYVVIYVLTVLDDFSTNWVSGSYRLVKKPQRRPLGRGEIGCTDS